jgi:lysyl-tRNA synthetase class 2
LELANGYRELTDADEQRRRFAADVQRREAAGAPVMATDPAFMAALEHGLPDCCGVAVGFDRVVMCALGLDSIDAAISFAL